MTDKLSKAEVAALVHVAAGSVTQIFTPKGNTYQGPRGTAPRTWRKLAALKLIEDVPGQTSTGVYARHFKQRLTKAGRKALNEVG